MNRSTLAAAFVFALAFRSESAHAEDAALSIFGIELGKPLTIPECQYSLREVPRLLRKDPKIKEFEASYSRPTKDESSPCYQRNVFTRSQLGTVVDRENIAIEFSFGERPLFGKNIVAYVLGGKVERISFDTQGLMDQETVFSSIEARLGPPSSIEKPVVKNLNGAEFESIVAQWRMQNGTIAAYTSVLHNLTEGHFYIGTAEGIASYEKQFKKPESRTQF